MITAQLNPGTTLIGGGQNFMGQFYWQAYSTNHYNHGQHHNFESESITRKMAIANKTCVSGKN